MLCFRFRIRRKEDRISALPDPLLHHILSFLPTNHTITTSFLSKRWRILWRSQLSLYFDGKPFGNNLSLSKFLNSFVTRRDETLPILSLHLYCCFFNNDFSNLVFAAITRGVQTLIINLNHHPNFYMKLSPLVLTTKTLSVLKLKWITLDYQSVDLPLLKVLHLEYTNFKSDPYLETLLSGCPILQELQTKDLTMSFPHKMSPTISLECLHNVEHLHIQLNNIPSKMVMFHNLTHMELIFKFDNPSCGVSKWSWLIKLLQNTPNLQTLIIDEVDAVRWNIEEWEDPEVVPECLLSHLTRCSLRNYSSINWEFRFAKYIMQNSRVLSTMAIQSAKFLKTSAKIQNIRELSSCSRISATCKLLFI